MIQIQKIPHSSFLTYRTDVMFDGYKWDWQAGEQSTISDRVILVEPDDLNFLSTSAVALYHETVAMEQALKHRPNLVLKMGISEEMATALCNCDYNPSEHIRLMRFDFHPTHNGWALSEVNSDVPAGYPEASILPAMTAKYFAGYSEYGNFAEVLTTRIAAHLPDAGTIAYLHDTHTVEDYQILHLIGDIMERQGHKSIYAAPSFIQWINMKAIGADFILRYYPIEWMECTSGVDWHGFVNSKTPSCNHPIALLTQSKRLPLVWDSLGLDVSTWKALLPETSCPTSIINKADMEGWILKPAFGRVGEGINIPGTVSVSENIDILAAANNSSKQWVAQRMFQSKPFDGRHLCIGVFVIDGQFAGLYGRASETPRIDKDAADLPVLVKTEGEQV